MTRRRAQVSRSPVANGQREPANDNALANVDAPACTCNGTRPRCAACEREARLAFAEDLGALLAKIYLDNLHQK
jgi:hypothetical protein